MSRALLSEPLVDHANLMEQCGWSKIAAAVRARAELLQAEATDLMQWAEFLEGIAALEARKG